VVVSRAVYHQHEAGHLSQVATRNLLESIKLVQYFNLNKHTYSPTKMDRYEELLNKTRRPDLQKKSTVKLIGYKDTIAEIKKRIQIQQNFIATGPSGVGKTTVIRRIAEGSKLKFMYIKASWTTAKRFGDPESQLGDLFEEAITKAPSLIFIDKIDHIGESKRSQSDIKDRVFNMLEDQLDYLQSLQEKVLVIAATNKPEALDPDLLKYFDDEIRFTLPSRKDRLEMLKELFPKFLSNELELIADATHCYLYKDLKRLRTVARIEDPVKLTYESVKVALTKFKPKTIRDYTTPCPPMRWEDIGGVEDVKKELQDSVIKPLKNQARFKKFGLDMDRGALLYGPPGCSKTMLSQALATESGFNFISIKGPQLFSKYVGDSEAAIRRLYRNAREIAPCIIFFDEIDGFATERADGNSSSVGDKVVTQILTEFNGPPDGVFTLAATNRPHRVDSALLRPGRLDSAIYIPLPSLKDRAEIFKVHMRGLPLRFELPVEQVAEQLASKTDSYSGAEIRKVCRTASRYACLESDENEFIEMRHFLQALENVKPTTSIEHLTSYDKFYKRTLKSGQRASLAGAPLRELHDDFNLSLNLD
jgi:SpoVK/Ycf46/Vps4 family AAA+-type ATPase